MTWGTFLFIVILYGKFVNMAYLLTYLVCIFAHFRIDEFGIYLCGQNGLMPQHFLQSFQWHPFEDGQNGEGVTSDMRGDFGMAIALLPIILRLRNIVLYSPTGKTQSGESFFSSASLYFSISSMAMGNNFTT